MGVSVNEKVIGTAVGEIAAAAGFTSARVVDSVQAGSTLATVINGLSPLALAISGKSIAAQNQQLIKAVASSLAPTIYCDPSLVSGNGSGSSAANACRTIAELQAAVNGDKPGGVVGFKRGTTFATGGDLILKTGSSRNDRPLVFCPYGDESLPLPIIDAGIVVNTWSVDGVVSGAYSCTMSPYAQTIWQVMADGSEKRLHWIYENTLASKQSALATRGAGYCFWDNGTFYCIPYDNVDPRNASIMIRGGGTKGNAALTIAYANQSISGNVIVYGIAVRHHKDEGITVSSDGAVGSVTSLGMVNIVGCDIQHNGDPIDLANYYKVNFAATINGSTGVMTVSTVYATGNTSQYISPGMTLSLPSGIVVQSQLTGTAGGAGTYQTNYSGANDNSGATRVGSVFNTQGNDAIRIYGISDSIRPTIRVASNFIRDCGNNAVEVALINGGYSEFNTVVDACSHAWIEFYGTCTNVVSRYNFATWSENQNYPWYVKGYPAYMGRIYWQACVDAATLSSPAPTNTIALKTNNNRIEYNVAVNCPGASTRNASGLILNDPMKDDGCPNFTVQDNTISISVAQASEVMNGPIFGNSINSGNGAAWTCLNGAAAPVFSRNILKMNSGGANIRILLVSPNYGSFSSQLTGDNNIYYSDNNSTNFNVCNKGYDNITSTSLITTLASWVSAASMDAASKVLNPMLDANGLPYIFSPALRYGAYAGALAMIDGYPLA